MVDLAADGKPCAQAEFVQSLSLHQPALVNHFPMLTRGIGRVMLMKTKVNETKVKFSEILLPRSIGVRGVFGSMVYA
ncbi:MAG: hypothetical protein SF162_12335 [bacterium]|nr:hypothetical protein [bacterium]